MYHHVVVPNFAPLSTELGFNQIWKLTRALKKAGWKYLASGYTTKDTSADPELDLWGAGTSSGTTGGGAIAAPERGRARVTGLVGIVASDKGKFLHVDGSGVGANNHYHQIEEVISATEVAIDARTFAVGAETGSITWEIRDPLGDTYPSGLTAVVSWILMRGPSTLKIPITSAPTLGPTGATFFRGENLVQTTTGAEGELAGVVYLDGVGYLVVIPRVRGTGTGVYGWDTSYVITGSVSGASVAQDGATVEYRYEMVVGKDGTAAAGYIWIGSFDPVADAADMFSAKLAAASATVPPGGSADFPAFAYVLHGGAAFASFHWSGHQSGYYPVWGNAQIMVADAIEAENYSVDGSWTLARANTQSPGGGHDGYGFYRMEDCEEGDLDPYVGFNGCIFNVTYPLYSASGRTAGCTNMQSYDWDQFCSSSTTYFRLASASYPSWKGWRCRGLSSDGSANFQNFEDAILGVMASFSGTCTPVISANYAYGDRVATAPAPTKVREPLWLISIQAGRKMRKGTPRWISLVSGGNGTDLYDNKTLLQLSGSLRAWVVGPWDGVSIPTAF